MTRAERAKEAQRLRAQGLVYREIAGRMGISRRYAQDLVKDPDGHQARLRKQSYGRPCIDCGVTTDGSNGRAKAPARCRQCHTLFRHEQARSEIIAAIRRFHGRYGYPPVASDFNPPHAMALGKPESAERFVRDGDYPSTPAVQAIFGTWNVAIAEAGFEPIRAGAHLGDFTAEKRAEAVALYQSGLSGPAVAKRIGCTSGTIYEWLDEAGVPRRSPWAWRDAA